MIDLAHIEDHLDEYFGYPDCELYDNCVFYSNDDALGRNDYFAMLTN
jgi:hypothetical protein